MQFPLHHERRSEIGYRHDAHWRRVKYRWASTRQTCVLRSEGRAQKTLQVRATLVREVEPVRGEY